MELSVWRQWWKERGETELRALLMAEWDPIGSKNEPLAADEYDSYIPPLARKLREGASPEDVAAFLDTTEVGMGFEPAGRNTAVAKQIVRWYADSTGYFAKPS